MSTPVDLSFDSPGDDDEFLYDLEVDSSPFTRPRDMRRAMNTVLARLNDINPDVVDAALQAYDTTAYEWYDLRAITSFSDPRILIGMSPFHTVMKTLHADNSKTLFRVHAVAHGNDHR